MMRKFKLFAVFVLLALVLSAGSSVALAGDPGPPGELVPVDLGDLGVVKVRQFEDRGALVRILPPGNYKAEVFPALDAHFTQQMRSHGTAAHTNNASTDGASIQEVVHKSDTDEGWNSSARSFSSHWGYRDRGWTVTINVDGYSSGSWHGSGTADHIVLNEELCFHGASLTISWPASLEGSDDCGTYESIPFQSTNWASQSYSEAEANSYVALFGTTQTDSATVRINSHDYRPYSEVNLDWGL